MCELIERPSHYNIIIELVEGISELMAKQYLSGSCLGMAILQRDRVANHSGTMFFYGRGIIFIAERRAGKLIITSAFCGKDNLSLLMMCQMWKWETFIIFILEFPNKNYVQIQRLLKLRVPNSKEKIVCR